MMKRFFQCGSLLLIGLLTSFAHAQVLGVPAYNYPDNPGSFWLSVTSVPKGSIFILNPNSGVGETIDPGFVSVVQKAQAAGVKIYGYVYTQYGKRPVKTVVAQAGLYKKWYGVDGIFLDEAGLEATNYDYYRALSIVFHSRALRVAFNPGQPNFEQRFLPLSDEIVSFEGSYGDYQKAVFPAWMKTAPGRKFWHLVHNVPDTTAMQQALALSRQRNAGVVYATSDVMPNPWDQLPTYWSAETSALK